MATEIRYCTNPNCTATWEDELDQEAGEDPLDPEDQDCLGRNPKLCETCRNAGYTITAVYWNRWNVMKNGDLVHICTKCVSKKKPTIFVPYDSEYMCANKNCGNSWLVHLTEPLSMMICGGGDKVCSDCTQAGFKISSVIGDGKFYLYQNGITVAVYNYEEAYSLNKQETIKEPDCF
jgi:hypothetical protein